jgi:Ca2+-binding EF-hand superfamily protein
MNRGVSPDEFDQAATKRFALLDKNGDGLLERDELPSVSGLSRMGPGRRPPQAQE